MEEVCIYASILNSGDGGIFIRWYLTEEEANKSQEEDEGWCGTYNVEDVQTFVGSNVYNEAIKNG